MYTTDYTVYINKFIISISVIIYATKVLQRSLEFLLSGVFYAFKVQNIRSFQSYR